MCRETPDFSRDPDQHPGLPIYDYASPHIRIPNEEGKEKILLNDCYRDCVTSMNSWVKVLKSQGRPPGIELPASVYPPHWDQRRTVIHAIQIAAKDQGNMMLPVDSASEEASHLYLRCYRGILNTKCWKTAPDVPEPGPYGIVEPVYKADIKRDTYVNKSKNTRGTEKNEGICLCRRVPVDRPKTKEERCEFSIRLDLIPGQCWYLPYRKSVFGRHTKHADIDPRFLNIGTKYMSAEQTKHAVLVSRHATGGTGQNIVNELNEEGNGKHHVLTSQQLRYLKKKHAVGNEGQGAYAERDKSGSERLIDALDQKVAQKKLRYVRLMHKVTETSLLALSKAQLIAEREEEKLRVAQENAKAAGRDPNDISDSEKRKFRSLSIGEVLEVAAELSYEEHDVLMHYTCHRDPDAEPQELPFLLEDIHDKLSFGKNLMKVREVLRVDDEIMIGSAWAREDECLIFEKFPEVFMFDVTFGTNAEKRPLGIGGAFDGDMNTFTPLRVFMPSQCAWVFNWIFGQAMPALFGADLLDRIQLFLTDGDRLMYGAFDKCKRDLYRNAHHGLCMYHLVVQGINRNKSKMKGWDTVSVRNMVETFKQFLFSWMRVGEIESEEEYRKSKQCLETWLTRLKDTHANEAVRHNVGVLSDFLTVSILPHKERWLACLRQHRLTLLQRTTSALEGVNQTIKGKASHTVIPTMGLAESLDVQGGQWDAKMDQYHKHVWKQHQSFRTYVSGSMTVDKVWGRCESEIHKNTEQRRNYHVRCVDWQRIELLQRRDDEESPIFCLECSAHTTCGPCSDMSPIPRFRRIRTLTFHPLDPHCVNFEVTCSCPYYTTLGIPCRHFAVFCQILPRHCIIRHWIQYHALYKTKMGSPELDEYFLKKQKDMRLKITREEYDHIMKVACGMEEASESYLFECPRSMMFQRNADGMLAFSRVASPNEISRDEILMNRDMYAVTEDSPDTHSSVEMTQVAQFPVGVATPSPTRTAMSSLFPLLNGAHNATTKILSLFQSVEDLYKDLPRQLNTISDGLVHFLEKAIERRRVEMKPLERERKGDGDEISRTATSKKRRVKDLYPATDRSRKHKRLKPAYEVSRKHAPPSRKTALTLHSRSN